MTEIQPFMIEDAKIVFRNFSGREGMYNREGDRNFCAILDEATAEQMSADGWNIKTLKEKEEGDGDVPYIQVSVGYKLKPPRVTLISSKGRVPLDEEAVGMLDMVEIEKVDFIARPYEWSTNGKTGIKAYLQTMFVTIREDALERRYAGLDT